MSNLANNTAALRDILEMVNDIQVGGDTSMEDGYVTATITEYRNDRVKSVGAQAFQYNKFIKSFDFPEVTSIGNYAFYNGVMTNMNLPKLVTAGTNAFQACKKLQSLTVPALKTLGNMALADCSALTEATFPALTSTGQYAFRNCTALSKLDFGSAVRLGSNAFYSCSGLKALIIRSTTMAPADDFGVCGIMDGERDDAYIYVPRALVSAYDNEWYGNYGYGPIRALEDYTVDGTTTGELDETKI